MLIKDVKEGNSSARVSLTGGTVTRWQVNGTHVIFPEQDMLVNNGLESRGGIPICCPYFGPAKGSLTGKAPQHGWLRDQRLELLNASDNKVEYYGMLEEKEVYPWQLESHFTVMIEQKGLVLELKLTKIEDKVAGEAPVNPAFHPYFNSPDGGIVYNGQEKIEFKGEFPAKTIPTNSQIIHIELKGIGTVKMYLLGSFKKEPYLTLWSDSDKYFCVEPILGNPDNFNKISKGLSLKQGRSLVMTCALTFTPFN